MKGLFDKWEVILSTFSSYFSGFDFAPPAHIIYRQMMAFCHTSRCLCHTHTHITTLDTHNQQHVPVPFVTLPLAPPPSVPFACHITSTSLPPLFCACVTIYMSVCALMGVYWTMSAHTSPSPIWNMAVSAWPVYLHSYLQQKTLVAPDGRSTPINNSVKHTTPTGNW